jgi:hypothetical protein
MALVGPRAETEEHVLRWKQAIPEYERRFTVLPGVTGLAQISGYSDSEAKGISRRAQYDLYYVDHRSLLLDIRTLVRTMSVVFRGDGFLRHEPGPVGRNVVAGHFAPGHRASAVPRVVAPGAEYAVQESTEVKGVTK